MTRKQKKLLFRILLAALLTLAVHWIPAPGLWKLALYLIPYFIVGYDVLRKAVKGIGHGQLMDENFLMAVATVGALVIGAMGSGEYLEAISVMLFYQIGELFQSYAVGKSRRSIARLMDIRPDHANLLREGVLEQVDPEEVAIGTEILIQTGEKVPLDGIVTEGTSTLDTGALTGESMPRDIGPGQEIYSGCINLSGVLTVRTTKEFGDSTVAKILDMVENASSRKSRSEAFISRFARVYTPLVCIGALLLALVPPLARQLIMGLAPQWGDWAYRALTFLVISCPCALVISIPLSFFAGIGGAGKAGVLVKGSNYLEALSKTRTVVFDKTGTLTRGRFDVTAVHSVSLPEQELLRYAALADCASSHPISRSLLRAWGGTPDRTLVSQIREHSGAGITATVEGVQVGVGSEKLMEQLQVPCPQVSTAAGAVYISMDGSFAGWVEIADTLKPTAAAAVAALADCGVSQTVMLTGDTRRIAQETAKALGITRVYGELLPGDKVAMVEKLLETTPKNARLAFVGDGINDAPVLARADIGIAMGAMGSDAAIEAADVVLMDDDPMKIPKAIRISRKCLRIVYENIIFATGIKVLCLILGALGIANMWMAIFADVGVMVLAVLNAIRALSVRRL